MAASYDVFLSFRGEDTSNNFVDHLYAALVQEQILVFKHLKDDGMQTISEDVVKAIKESRFAVVVFSKNYANSSLCLEELSTIMECHDQMGGQKKVLPVFYHVDPSDICVQEGKVEKVKKWRIALTAATANLSGFKILPDNMGESALITEIVEVILADKQPRGSSRLDVNTEKIGTGFQHVETIGRTIGKLIVSEKEIGKGSNGTFVLEGSFDIRPVAVKRIVKTHHVIALKEIQNLIDSDHHANIVRYYGVEYGPDFVYIALERCICSLHDLILSPTTVDPSQLTLSEVESFKVPEPIGYPSPELLKVMRDTAAGLAHLHELGFIHRDLKPQNVLICKYSSIIAKVSDMGISKRLPADKSSLTKSATGYGSSGWQAPETLRQEPQTRAVDLFGFGCLLFFCITGGRHPFGGNMHERDINIVWDRKDLSLLNNIPEAIDLVSNLLHRVPRSRPSAAEVYHHPLFWDPDMRLDFFHDVSQHSDESKVSQALESIGKVDYDTVWRDKVDDHLLQRAKYDFHKVSELIRLIRNKVEHFMQLPEDFRAQLGNVSTGLEAYFRERFPNLLMKVYKVLFPFGEEEAWLKVYYKKTVVLT